MNYTQILERTLDNDEVDFNLDALRLKVEVATGASMPVLLRSEAKRPLTAAEMDNNFQSLDLAVQQALYGDGPKPSLDLRFSGAKFLDPRISFTRASKATYWGADGKLHEADIDEPRFEYDPATGEALGLLVEGQATNLLRWSQDFANAAWTKSRVTVQPTSEASSYGAPYKKMAQDSGTGNGYITQIIPSDGPSAWTALFVVKYAEFTSARIEVVHIGETDGDTSSIAFNLIDGTHGAIGGRIVRASSTALTCGGFLISVSWTTELTEYTQARLQTVGAGDDASGILVTVTQLEEGTHPTSYIPTEGSQVTRAADTPVMPTEGWFNQAEGTFVVDVRALVDDWSPGPPILGTNLNECNPIMMTTQGFLAVDFRAYGGEIKTIPHALTVGVDHKVAVSFKSDGTVYMVFDGFFYNRSMSAFDLSGMSELRVLKRANGVTLNGFAKRIAYYPKALSQAELEALTS